ncbi:hypothetical protein M440DRAFT_1340459, partial [Trichoderma longibrachiatum ATCC 18648]
SGRFDLGCPQSNATSMSSWVFVRISSAGCRVTSVQAAYCACQTKKRVECSLSNDDGRLMVTPHP